MQRFVVPPRIVRGPRYPSAEMFFLLLACAPKPPPPVAAGVLPHIPALTSEMYRRESAVPRDPLVAQVVGAHAWDQALSGAAGALALADIKHERVDARALRWHAIRAGYASSPSGMAMVTVAFGEIPTSIQEAVAHAQGDVGLARARARDGDHWVLLFADKPAANIPFPREVALRDVVSFTPARVTATDPYGSQHPSGETVTFDSAGEWLVQLVGPDGSQTTLPVYVGITTPSLPPLPAADPEGEVGTVALAEIDALRAWYGQGRLGNDGMLDSVARAHLRHVLDHVEADPDASLRAAGFIGEPAVMTSCTAPTVVDCLDRLWWSLAGRAPLVGDFHSISVAGERTTSGVTLVIAAAG